MVMQVIKLYTNCQAAHKQVHFINFQIEYTRKHSLAMHKTQCNTKWSSPLYIHT